MPSSAHAIVIIAIIRTSDTEKGILLSITYLLILFIADAELVSNKIAKTFFDLSVTWNGGFSPIFGIHVDVVLSTMPFQMAAGSHQFANEVKALQISTPISF